MSILGVFVLCAVIIAFIFFWFVFYKKEEEFQVNETPKEKIGSKNNDSTEEKYPPDAVYVCPECGEMHCNCYKEHNDKA